LHDGEVLLPRTLNRPGQRDERDAGAAVNKQKNGIVHVLTANVNPLIDAADADGFEEIDALW